LGAALEITVEVEALAFVDAHVLADKELVVAVGVLDRTNLILIIDKVPDES
jgi:hypothetical protein